MTLNLGAVNIFAALVAAVVTFLIGGVWYTVLFGQKWRDLHGYSDEKMQAMQAMRPMPVYFGILVLCYVVVSFVVALIIGAFDVRGAASGALLGFLLWLGPAAAIGMTGHVSSDRPWGVYFIDTAYQLIYLPLIGAIIAAWR